MQNLESGTSAHYASIKLKTTTNSDSSDKYLTSSQLKLHTLSMEHLPIGQAIKALRLAQNMTQEELIEKADLSRSQLYYIESGKRTPRLPTMQSICAALEVSFLDFVHYVYQYSPTSSTPSISSMEAPGATIG